MSAQQLNLVPTSRFYLSSNNTVDGSWKTGIEGKRVQESLTQSEARTLNLAEWPRQSKSFRGKKNGPTSSVLLMASITIQRDEYTVGSPTPNNTATSRYDAPAKMRRATANRTWTEIAPWGLRRPVHASQGVQQQIDDQKPVVKAAALKHYVFGVRPSNFLGSACCSIRFGG